MRNPPNFIVWIILAREEKGDPFMPYKWFGLTNAFSSHSEAKTALRSLRTRGLLKRGNGYVQQYGPMC